MFLSGHNPYPERARLLHLARSGSQSQREIRFILPARGASHIISIIIHASLCIRFSVEKKWPEQEIFWGYWREQGISFSPSNEKVMKVTIENNCIYHYRYKGRKYTSLRSGPICIFMVKITAIPCSQNATWGKEQRKMAALEGLVTRC